MITDHFANPSLRQRLLADETIFGLFVVEMRTPNMGTLLDIAGYDFAIFDMEHGSYTLSDMAVMLPGFRGCHCAPFVRVPTVRREFIQPLLDLGVTGIVVPMVETAADAQACVQLMKYPPVGKRGVAYCRPHALFRTPTDSRFTAEANENTLLVVQIESAQGLAHVDEILAVPGIDVAFVGNADLAQSLGCPPALESGRIRDAMETVLKSAAAHKVVGGGNVADPGIIADLHKHGLRFVTLTSDVERFLVGLQTVIHDQRTRGC